jgi:hypothetical protein
MSLRSEVIRILNEYFLGSKKITQLNAAAALDGTELVEVVQSGANVKTTTQDIANLGGAGSSVKVIQSAFSDVTTAITAGTNKVTFRMPYAMTLTAVRASLSTAQTSGNIFTVDIHESGTTILSTKITIDNGEKTSTTAVTPPVISDASLADDAEITIDVDQIGDGTAKGGVITLIGT